MVHMVLIGCITVLYESCGMVMCLMKFIEIVMLTLFVEYRIKSSTIFARTSQGTKNNANLCYENTH